MQMILVFIFVFVFQLLSKGIEQITDWMQLNYIQLIKCNTQVLLFWFLLVVMSDLL